jgi:hypothetical protein
VLKPLRFGKLFALMRVAHAYEENEKLLWSDSCILLWEENGSQPVLP